MTDKYKFGWSISPEMQRAFDALDKVREEMDREERNSKRIQIALMCFAVVCYGVALFAPLIARLK
jgi:hypothetical protein